jgi:hypothetical protein
VHVQGGRSFLWAASNLFKTDASKSLRRNATTLLLLPLREILVLSGISPRVILRLLC